ncbi:hypothetical protein SAMN04488000_110298 [Lentzea albida]|uniref:Uncharacterized protein n=1 Tax=Lentzea albida TaxID=65499 RepID=A0A1H9QX33_9PSEU|nr:hypothetical protein SAMN04488000_110298 [Lentzea albida]
MCSLTGVVVPQVEDPQAAGGDDLRAVPAERSPMGVRARSSRREASSRLGDNNLRRSSWSVRRSPLGGGHDAAPAERYSAKAIVLGPGDSFRTDQPVQRRALLLCSRGTCVAGHHPERRTPSCARRNGVRGGTGGRRGRRGPRRPDALKPPVGEADCLRASWKRPVRSVASRRVALRGTSRTVFRGGVEVRPGGHGSHRPTCTTGVVPVVFPERSVWSLTACRPVRSDGTSPGNRLGRAAGGQDERSARMVRADVGRPRRGGREPDLDTRPRCDVQGGWSAG